MEGNGGRWEEGVWGRGGRDEKEGEGEQEGRVRHEGWGWGKGSEAFDGDIPKP